MSHIVTIATKITDAAVAAACQRLNLPEPAHGTAKLLAEGHGTSDVARLLGVTLPVVSISRTWLEASWREFQGQVERAAVPAVKRSVGRPRKAVVVARG